MNQIRVDPSMLRQSARDLSDRAEQLRQLGQQIWQVAESAPSYDGQFGPKVRSLAAEGHAQLTGQAQRLTELSELLLERADAFEAADQETQGAFHQLASAFQSWARDLGAWAPLAYFAGLIGLGRKPLETSSDGGEDDEEPPWWAPLVIGIADGWFKLDERLLSPLREGLKQAPESWRQNAEYMRILSAFYSTQARDWFEQHVGQPIEDFMARLPALQEPGLPADGPLTEAMLKLSSLNSNGDPISIVGYELVQLIDARGGVTVVFSDGLTGGGNAGVAPIRGMIWLPESYGAAAVQANPEKAALIGHEFAHVLQRDLPEFPDGWGPAGAWIFSPQGLDPFGFEYGSPIGGEFTLYMEVQSNIIQNTIAYDQLQAELAALPNSPQFLQARQNIEANMKAWADSLATYTGDARGASAYVVQDHNAYGMYVGEMVTEVVLGPRIPEGGWQHFLAEQGFSAEAIEHIEQIATQGTPIQVDIARFLGDGQAPVPPTGGTTQSPPSATPPSHPPRVRPD